MSHTKARVLQYIVILLILAVGGGGYWYWQNAQAGVAQKAANNLGLVAYWSFDEGNGTVLGDASGNGNHATLGTGAQIPVWVDGKFGKALSFDGDPDLNEGDIVNIPSVVVGNPTPLLNTHTVSMWVYPIPAGHDSYQSLFATNGGNGLYYHSGAIKKIDYYNDADNFSTGTLTENAWNHVVVVANAGSVTFYINGAAAGAASNMGGYTATNIGSDQFSEVFKGRIDETRVYSRALGAAEITALYGLGAAKVNASQSNSLTTGLIGYWPFNTADVSGVTAYDRSSSANNGTLTNGPTTTAGRVGQALNFDGTDDYVALPSTQGPQSAATYSAWIKPVSGSQNSGIFMSYSCSTLNSYMQFFTLGGNLQARIHQTLNNDFIGRQTTGGLTSGVWQHVTFTWSGGTTNSAIKIYINGVQADTTNDGAGTFTAPYSGSMPTRIGSQDCNNSYMNGSIDEARIYNRELSASEVRSLYLFELPTVRANSADSQIDPLEKGLSAYWKLDDASGTSAIDASGNAYTGTLTGANGLPTWTTGQIGGATSFDGVDDHIDTNATLGNFGTGDFSISVWIKTAGNGFFLSKRAVCAHDSFWNIRVTVGGVLKTEVDQDGAGTNYITLTGTKIVNDNQWHHAVLVRSGASLAIYADGTSDGTASAAGAANLSNAANLQIGKNICGSPFPGSVDEARVYNRALSLEEVTKLYKTTAPDNPDTGLVGYWSFNGPDISGVTAYDRSRTGNNGTLTGGPTTIIGKLGQALSFDGTDDYVDVGTSTIIKPAGGISFTASLWYKGAGTGTKPFIAAPTGVGQSFWSVGEGGASFYNQGESTSGTNVSYTLPADNEWHHIVATLDRSTSPDTVTAYIDGVTQGSATEIDGMDGGSAGGIGNTYIGRENWSNPTIYRSGPIDEVRIYRRAFTQAEVTALYNLGR